MALCKDKAISELNNLGYDMVRFPRPDINVLDVVVASSNTFSRLASLPSLWESGAKVPAVSPVTAPSIRNVSSAELKGSVGLGAIAEMFRANIGAAGRAAKSIRFIAMDPVILTCDHAALENYVSAGEPRSDAVASRHFMDENARTYVITEVIGSKQLQIVVGKQSDIEANAAAADISKSISAEIKAGSASSTDNVIMYQRDEPAIFGFKSAEIYFEVTWLLDLPIKPGKGFLGRGPEPTLLAPSSRLSLTDVKS